MPDRVKAVLLLDGTLEGGLVERALRGAGLEPHRALDVPGAERVLGGTRLDLVIAGLEAEGALGLCQLVRALPRGGAVPILLLGGEGAAVRSTADAVVHGADGFLARPVTAEELLDKIEALIGPLAGREPAPDRSLEESGAPPSREPTQVLPDPAASPVDRLRTFASEDHADATAETELRAVTDLPTGLRVESEEPEGSQARTRAGAQVGERSADDEATGLRRPPSAFPRSSRGPWSSPVGHGRPGAGLPSPPSGILPADSALFDDASLLGDDPLAHLPDWSDGPGRPEAESGDLWDEAPRPEKTHVLGEGAAAPLQPSRAGRGEGVPPARAVAPALPGADAELSDEFRRVIDEVALRLFPEDDLDDFDDEAFDELRTIVPAVSDPRAPMYEDLDDFSLESMETFAGSEGGLTLSLFDEPTRPRENEGAGAAHKTGVQPTLKRSDEPDAAVAPPAGRPEREGSWGEARPSRPLHPFEGEPAGPSEATEPIPAVRIGERSLSHGSLGDHPVPVLLAACLEGAVRARLVLRRGGDDGGGGHVAPRERVVVLDEGRPVTASSTEATDRLIEMLRLQGRLTAAQHDRCRAMVASTGRRPGAILVELGLAKPDELLPLVRWHFAEIVFAAFSWREGTFRLEPVAPGFRPRIQIERRGDDLLLEGLRRRYGHEDLVPVLGGRAARLKRRPARDRSLPAGLLSGEPQLLDLCDGTRSLEQVIDASGLDRAQACAVLYGLALLGHLEVPEVGELPRLDTAEADRGAERAQLEERIHQCREGDYFSILGLRPDATTYEVRLAHERRASELAPARLAEVGAADLEPLVAEVRYVVDEALDVLSDDALRKAYRASRFGPSEPSRS